MSQFTYTGTKLNPWFNTKDKTKLEHEHDVAYLGKCLENSCDETYIGETARRFSKRFLDHSGWNKNCRLFRNAKEHDH